MFLVKLAILDVLLGQQILGLLDVTVTGDCDMVCSADSLTSFTALRACRRAFKDGCIIYGKLNVALNAVPLATCSESVWTDFWQTVIRANVSAITTPPLDVTGLELSLETDQSLTLTLPQPASEFDCILRSVPPVTDSRVDFCGADVSLLCSGDAEADFLVIVPAGSDSVEVSVSALPELLLGANDQCGDLSLATVSGTLNYHLRLGSQSVKEPFSDFDYGVDDAIMAEIAFGFAEYGQSTFQTFDILKSEVSDEMVVRERRLAEEDPEASGPFNTIEPFGSIANDGDPASQESPIEAGGVAVNTPLPSADMGEEAASQPLENEGSLMDDKPNGSEISESQTSGMNTPPIVDWSPITPAADQLESTHSPTNPMAPAESVESPVAPEDITGSSVDPTEVPTNPLEPSESENPVEPVESTESLGNTREPDYLTTSPEPADSAVPPADQSSSAGGEASVDESLEGSSELIGMGQITTSDAAASELESTDADTATQHEEDATAEVQTDLTDGTKVADEATPSVIPDSGSTDEWTSHVITDDEKTSAGDNNITTAKGYGSTPLVENEQPNSSGEIGSQATPLETFPERPDQRDSTDYIMFQEGSSSMIASGLMLWIIALLTLK
eukprot:Protomagalhaensia_wolfi_Nauph_80__6035@NODE_833_length_1965_cov_32_415369_g627_i0_p1_GENE_NODE_833_length_1965_cov_32_415369_g627_i0NODE_833_length_1965_cov_32_415369_g627_i0_p1_ORF_typecomplete_len618_score95_49_NODE_833_length_1965_cov_32_415369_g627_i0751928